MHGMGMAICLVAGLVAGAAVAQTLPDGPLAAPDSAPAKPHAPKSRKPAKPVHHAEAKAKTPHALPDPTAPAVPVVSRPASGAAADPLSLGMKWNGSNDNAEKTRVQNYGGDAAGTGAAVGLNYHF